jgi:hypothetical protein
MELARLGEVWISLCFYLFNKIIFHLVASSLFSCESNWFWCDNIDTLLWTISISTCLSWIKKICSSVEKTFFRKTQN